MRMTSNHGPTRMYTQYIIEAPYLLKQQGMEEAVTESDMTCYDVRQTLSKMQLAASQMRKANFLSAAIIVVPVSQTSTRAPFGTWIRTMLLLKVPLSLF